MGHFALPVQKENKECIREGKNTNFPINYFFSWVAEGSYCGLYTESVGEKEGGNDKVYSGICTFLPIPTSFCSVKSWSRFWLFMSQTVGSLGLLPFTNPFWVPPFRDSSKRFLPKMGFVLHFLIERQRERGQKQKLSEMRSADSDGNLTSLRGRERTAKYARCYFKPVAGNQARGFGV